MFRPLLSIFFLLFSLLPARAGYGADSAASNGSEETMLMFVGENIEALTIASRREESAWQAPAVAQVISREQLLEHGSTTLSEALATLPGFHMAEKPWGTSPYLRGISNSTLFLYDTVPLDADSDKSLHQLDYNLSTAPIKRIEIVRGPGSVLWGPDAFAGIVNVVPMTGRDLDGIETGVSSHYQDQGQDFYLNMGQGDALWDGFLSVSGRNGREDETSANLTRFWGDDPQVPVAPLERYGDDEPGRSGYLDATGLLSYRDLLKLSGRISDSHHPYAVSDEINGTWLEERNTSSSFLKLEANKPLTTTSSLRFTGFYNALSPEYQIIDRELEVKERTSYGELIYDHSFFTGRGLLTGGLSFRSKHVTDAPVWESYLPDFIGPGNEDLLPILLQEDYSDTLRSGFGQYTHQAGNLKAWLGTRFDDHDEYQDNASFSSGVGYSPTTDLIMKLLYGTAYRTPSSRQLLTAEKPDQEKIETVEAQLAYNPTKKVNFSVVAFTSGIADHIKEDPYAQLSLPNSQDIHGLELEGNYTILDQFTLGANLTLLDNKGPDETYHLLTAIFIRPDGSVEYIYEDVISPYDPGPKKMFNLSGTWKPADKLSLVADLRYFSERDLINARTGVIDTAESVWQLDATLRYKDIMAPGIDLTLIAKNIFDADYETPSIYEMMDGQPFTMEILLQKRW
ncbi:MAG: TonB-dependent receptor [Deltaproteobacteria bacterium]|nr:TonB-dependent receptor [Deltaproteobacteria bacterium]